MAQFRRRRFAEITGKIKIPLPPPNLARRGAVPHRNHPVRLIAIGASTGGPPALQTVIPKLPRSLPVGVVVAQHMPAAFTASLADRLNDYSQVTVREAVDGEPVEPGTVLLAPGGRHLIVKRQGAKSFVMVTDYPTDALYHPCVDVLMNSVAESYGRASMAVMLTGMGRNGLDGMRKLKNQGAVTIAQDEQSCVVYGMPRAVIEAGIIDHVASIDDIAQEMLSYF